VATSVETNVSSSRRSRRCHRFDRLPPKADGAGEVVDGPGSGTPTPRILVDSASRPARTTALPSAVDGLIDTETFKSDRAAMAV